MLSTVQWSMENINVPLVQDNRILFALDIVPEQTCLGLPTQDETFMTNLNFIIPILTVVNPAES